MVNNVLLASPHRIATGLAQILLAHPLVLYGAFQVNLMHQLEGLQQPLVILTCLELQRS